MKKNTKITAKNNNINKETKMEEIMKSAEVKVQVKGTTEETNIQKEEEIKEKRVYRSFKEIILSRIDNRAKGINKEDYLPIRDKIASALDELQVVFDDNREFNKTERNINRRLSKFTKEQIEAYLASLPSEE
jgi:hypothetical protein